MAFITTLTVIAKSTGVNRIVAGVAIPHPCGNPDLSDEDDRALRRDIVKTALDALQTDVDGPTIFVPGVTFR